MSLFLAPIHHRVFAKIQYTNTIGQALLKEDPSLQEETNKTFKELEIGPLEEILDLSNIHGSLAQRVDLVEQRLAFVASNLVRRGKEENLLRILFQMGQKEKSPSSPMEAFEKMESLFLDGMPCDRVIEIQANSSQSLSFSLNKDVHGHYYIYGVDKNLFEKMRQSWLNGLLSKTDLCLDQDGLDYTIRFK